MRGGPALLSERLAPELPFCKWPLQLRLPARALSMFYEKKGKKLEKKGKKETRNTELTILLLLSSPHKDRAGSAKQPRLS